MQILLVVPGTELTGRARPAADRPRIDFALLADRLSGAGHDVVVYDQSRLGGSGPGRGRGAKIARAVLAAAASISAARSCDVVVTAAEDVGIALALLFKARGQRPRHIMVAHRLTRAAKRPFFTILRTHRQIDKIIANAQPHRAFSAALPQAAHESIFLSQSVDLEFWRPDSEQSVQSNQFCLPGADTRDHGSLLEAWRGLPDKRLAIAHASPWTRAKMAWRGGDLPSGVSVQRYTPAGLRRLYTESLACLVPLQDTDSSAGMAVIGEAMAMGKPVALTRTRGLRFLFEHGETALYVPPGDVEGWREVVELLSKDAQLRDRLARNGRRWVEENASLERWADTMARIIESLLPGAGSALSSTLR